MDLEERFTRALIATIFAGAFLGIGGGALAAWATGAGTFADGLWFYVVGGVLGVLAAGAYALTRNPDQV
ncbi:hypothetical protein OHS71_41195 (plasmid) [Streptomyces sp. NBC_00377]|uniref:hypothetical protein n=1 Tax=unclassified Streptomyces TaxID=2593676 RepID=UPI002E1A6902|nr:MULTISPECIES: hypothetical protein [unclassified Streptomyces]